MKNVHTSNVTVVNLCDREAAGDKILWYETLACFTVRVLIFVSANFCGCITNHENWLQDHLFTWKLISFYLCMINNYIIFSNNTE